MISLSMPLTATDFAVRLSPLKISYFFLPTASDGLIVSEITVPDESDYFTEKFPFFPLFYFRLSHSLSLKTVCVLLREDLRQRPQHPPKPFWWLVCGKFRGICGCTFSFSGDGISEGMGTC